MSDKSGRRLFLLGLDGADYDFVHEHLADLPFLRHLSETGGFVPLRSTVPAFTLTAWSTAMSGMNPGKTGVDPFPPEDFSRREIRVDSNSVRVPRIWDILECNGRPVVTINVPLTYPPTPGKNPMISGFMTPPGAVDWFQPPELAGEIAPGHLTCLDFPRLRDDSKAFLRELYAYTRAQFQTVENLCRTRPWDLFLFVVSGTDCIQHWFLRGKDDPESREKILEYFREVDRWAGNLLGGMKGTDLLVISDHGFGKIPSRTAGLNSFLAREGLLTAKTGSPRLRLSTAGLRRLPLAGLLRHRLPRRLRERVVRQTRPARGDIDWERTDAHFALFMNHTGYIRLRAGSGPGRAALLGRVREKLELLNRQAPGGPIFSLVASREELFTGPYRDIFPDLLIEFAPEWIGTEGLRDPVFAVLPPGTRPTATHRENGILLAAGPSIRRGWTAEAGLADIVPTVCRLLGIPSPSGADGRILTEIFLPEPQFQGKEQFREYLIPEKSARAYSEAEREDLRDRFVALGYL